MAKVSDADAKEFVAKKKELGIDPIYFHASYLINFADGGSGGHMSRQSLIAEMKVAEKIGARGSIVHLGSFKLKDGEEPSAAAYATLIKNIKTVLKETPKSVLFMIENAGSRKIGRSLDEIARIVKDVGDKRVRVCLDTCHLHVAGYDLRTPAKFDEFLKYLDKIIGLEKLELFHLNDSRDPFGSLRDRHENVCQGFVGKKVFEQLLNDPRTKNLPFISEAPGFDDNGPDRKNLEIIKNL